MKNRGFRYIFTIPELKYYLFNKKKCPICNKELKKNRNFEIRTDLFKHSGVNPVYAPNSNVKQYLYNYICNNCKYEITLSELTKKKKEKR